MLNNEYLIKPNGKPKVLLWKKVCATIGNMNVKRINICITEHKRKSPMLDNDRKFTMSITMAGTEPGIYKISQISLDKEELTQIRDSINQILND